MPRNFGMFQIAGLYYNSLQATPQLELQVTTGATPQLEQNYSLITLLLLLLILHYYISSWCDYRVACKFCTSTATN